MQSKSDRGPTMQPYLNIFMYVCVEGAILYIQLAIELVIYLHNVY